jgi:hypothetical protein
MLSLFQVLCTTGEASDHLAVPPDRGQHTLGMRTTSSIPVDEEEAGAEEDHVADIRLQPIQPGGDTATTGHTSCISHQPSAASRQPSAVTCSQQQQDLRVLVENKMIIFYPLSVEELPFAFVFFFNSSRVRLLDSFSRYSFSLNVMFGGCVLPRKYYCVRCCPR